MKVRTMLLPLLMLSLGACAPGATSGETTLESSTSSTAATVETTSPSTTTTVAETTTTTIDPTETFLADVPEGPSIWAITQVGYRAWDLVDGVWQGLPMTRFDLPADGDVPFAAGTSTGVVYQAGDGSVRFTDGSAEEVLAEPGAVLHDVVSDADGSPVAVVGPDGITTIDAATGVVEPLFEARVPQEQVSYGAGQLLLIRGTGAEAVASLVTRNGQSIRLDLLAAGAPVSAVLTPDGRDIVFSTDESDGALVYTLAVGSQGPAAAHALGVEGQVDHIDTDGAWVSGTVDETPFLLELGTGDVYFGPEGVRFAFDRTSRAYLQDADSVHLDGRFFGFVRSAREASVRFDEADFLTGEDAAEAAEAAGEESPPPNDFYIRNTSEDTERIPLAEDAEIRVQASYPEAGVDWEAITVNQWLRLLEGDATAVDFEWYGQGQLPYWITVEDGTIVLVEEFYLP